VEKIIVKSKRPTKNTTLLSKPLQSEEHPSRTIFEVEVLNGLRTACKSELLELLDKQIEILPSEDPDRIAFHTSVPLKRLMDFFSF